MENSIFKSTGAVSRGEITCHGIEIVIMMVSVYSDADTGGRHVNGLAKL